MVFYILSELFLRLCDLISEDQRYSLGEQGQDMRLTILPTLVGGAITLLAALLSFWLANRAERSKREEEAQRLSAAEAMSGLFKLVQWTNLLHNIKRHIDEFYKQAAEEGHQPAEPALTIGPSAGIFVEPSLLEAREYTFLAQTRSSNLIAKLKLLEERSINSHHLIKLYSKYHLELQAWMEEIPDFHVELDGPIATNLFPPAYRSSYEIRLAQLNRIIGGLVEHLDEDIQNAEDLVKEFANIAHEHFGSQFPRFSLERNE